MGQEKTQGAGWLTPREASRQLGISVTALRTWADRGQVASFRTPGGHRRFRRADLAGLAVQTKLSTKSQSLTVLVHSALGRTRLALTDGRLENEEWFHHFTAGAREEHRILGRHVLMYLAEALTQGSEEVGPDRLRALGRAYGEMSLRHGVRLGDSVRAFLFFRDNLIESLIELGETGPSFDVLTLLRQVNREVDLLMLEMVEVYSRVNSTESP